MKPLRDTVRRTLYVVIVVLALLALLAAFLDNAYNEQKFQVPLLTVLVILLALAVALFIHTELAYRSVKTAEAIASPLAVEEAPASAPVTEAEAEPEWEVQEEAPAPVVAEPAASARQDWTTTVKTRIVCNNCHTYFQADIPPARPQIVDCPSCENRVLLKEGPGRQDPPKTVACRKCDTLNEVVDVPDLASFVCINCGASNKLAAPIATTSRRSAARKGKRKPGARKGRGKKA